MSENQSIGFDQLNELAELKETNPKAYEKRLQNMKTVFVDWFRVMKQVAEEIEKGSD